MVVEEEVEGIEEGRWDMLSFWGGLRIDGGV